MSSTWLAFVNSLEKPQSPGKDISHDAYRKVAAEPLSRWLRRQDVHSTAYLYVPVDKSRYDENHFTAGVPDY
ncbi:MAG: hypothetical protein WEB00_15280 [Dehalococcoidia bacterium]